MEILKQKSLVVFAISGAILGIHIDNAHAEQKLSVDEMRAETGAFTPTGRTKLGETCNGTSQGVCDDHRGIHSPGTCEDQYHVSYPVCGKGDAKDECKVANWTDCYTWTYTSSEDADGKIICKRPAGLEPVEHISSGCYNSVRK